MPTIVQRVPITSKKFIGTIAAGQSVDVDPVDLTTFCATKYTIMTKNDVEKKHRLTELYAHKSESDDVTDYIPVKTDSDLNISLNYLKDGTDGLLRLVNNESFDVDFSIVKTVL